LSTFFEMSLYPYIVLGLALIVTTNCLPTLPTDDTLVGEGSPTSFTNDLESFDHEWKKKKDKSSASKTRSTKQTKSSSNKTKKTAPVCSKCTHTAKDLSSVTPVSSNWASIVKGNDQVVGRQYDGFTDWIDCQRKGPVRFEYVALRDCGCFERSGSFYIDTEIPRECQAKSAGPMGSKLDRGHMVPANHFDFSENAIKETNFMSNILPQTKELNRGAWLESEEIIECLREDESLFVVGGAVWPENPTKADKVLAKSHGIPVLPSAMWKIVRATSLHPEDNGIIAWWMPNDVNGGRDNLDSFLVSIDELEDLLKEHQAVGTGSSKFKSVAEQFYGFTSEERAHKPTTSWERPAGCDKM
jgi:endonuclease G